MNPKSPAKQFFGAVLYIASGALLLLFLYSIFVSKANLYYGAMALVIGVLAKWADSLMS